MAGYGDNYNRAGQTAGTETQKISYARTKAAEIVEKLNQNLHRYERFKK